MVTTTNDLIKAIEKCTSHPLLLLCSTCPLKGKFHSVGDCRNFVLKECKKRLSKEEK